MAIGPKRFEKILLSSRNNRTFTIEEHLKHLEKGIDKSLKRGNCYHFFNGIISGPEKERIIEIYKKAGWKKVVFKDEHPLNDGFVIILHG